MRVVIIGGTGHVGTYLVPRLVAGGHEVICFSRGRRGPYTSHAAWARVQMIDVDRSAEEAQGSFGRHVRDLAPDVVIDMICFTRDSARQLVEALHGEVQHLLMCCSVWVHGYSTCVPTTEDQPRFPFGEYGVQKEQIERYLLEAARKGGFPATVLHPGHIVGVGWNPLNPAGNFNPDVFSRLAKGESLALPNLGMETVHHVHADDVAQAFERCLSHRSACIGESFHVVSPAALTLRGYAESVAQWFGRPADLSFLPWEQWRATVGAEDAEQTWDHVAHSPCCSIDKARRLLAYTPRYTSLQAVFESLTWMVAQGIVTVS